MKNNPTETLYQEILRDFTSLGNSFILGLIALLTLGLTINFLYIIIGLVVLEIFGNIIKIIYFKERPNKQNYSGLVSKINASSFPSIHALRAAFVFFYLFLLAPNLLIKIIFLILLVIVPVTRINLKKHYFLDVLFGILVGIIFAVVLYLIT